MCCLFVVFSTTLIGSCRAISQILHTFYAMQTVQIIFYFCFGLVFVCVYLFGVNCFPCWMGMIHIFFPLQWVFAGSSFLSVCNFLTNFWSFPLFHASHTNADIIAYLLWAPCEKYEKRKKLSFFRSCSFGVT